MDSLLANYASSDEEEDEKPKTSFSLLSSLPPPKSSLFSSLPPPKPNPSNPPQTLTPIISPPNPKIKIESQESHKPSSVFSSLPQPKSSSSQFFLLPPPNPKKVIQFKPPPIKPINFDDEEDDEEDDEREREGRKTESFAQSTSAISFLSNLPAAKSSSSTLGALPSALGSVRRSIIESEAPSSNLNNIKTENQVGVSSNEVNFSGHSIKSEYGDASSGNYESYDANAVYGNYGNYDNYAEYNYNSSWGDGSGEVEQPSVVDESVMRVGGKRGRREIPIEVVEVKQDELMKNRPRPDQLKSTGIAFGPAYQPVSTKGKPTKLQKRKHQIGSLYFDMKQKESELVDRRSKGFLTKAETQAKYGW